MSARPLSSYRAAPEVPVLLWENPAGESEDELLLTQAGPSAGTKSLDPLVFELRKSAGKAFPHGITVGRMPNNDVTLDSRSISRFHAYFMKDAKGEWSLVDAQSKFGTWADSLKVEKAKPAQLKRRARVRFGSVSLLFLLPDAFTEYLAAMPKR